MKKVLLGMIIGVGTLLTASCADDYTGTTEVGNGVYIYNSAAEVLSIAGSVEVTAKIVGKQTAKIYLLKDNVETELSVPSMSITDNKLTATLTFAQLDLNPAVGKTAATIRIRADEVLHTHVVTLVEPEWKWTAAPSPSYSLMEKSEIENTLTFFVKAPWVEEGRTIEVVSVSGDREHTALAPSTQVLSGNINLGYVTFQVSEAFTGDSKRITVTARYTAKSGYTTPKMTFTYDYSAKQDTYSKSAVYTFTDANEVSVSNPNNWTWEDELQTFYGLYDGKEYVGRPTGDDAKQPVLYVANGAIYNLFNSGDYALGFVTYPSPQGLGLTDRSLAEAALSTGATAYATLPTGVNEYYHVRIGGNSGEKGVGTLHLRKTLDGKYEFSLKYGDRRKGTE